MNFAEAARLIASGAPNAPAALRFVEREAKHIGGELPAFIEIVGSNVRALAPFARHASVAALLIDVAGNHLLNPDDRRRALKALTAAPETPALLRAATQLQFDRVTKTHARGLLDALAAARGSTIEELAALSAGATLRDAGQPVKIDEVLDLGRIDFGSTRWQVWDPVQVSVLEALTVPASRAQVFAATSGTCARALMFRFARGKVTKWRRGESVSGPFGTLVVSAAGVPASVDDETFWDEVFDDAFDDAHDAAAVLDLSDGSPLLAWQDRQMGGTFHWGTDTKGRKVALLYDGVRVTPVDRPE